MVDTRGEDPPPFLKSLDEEPTPAEVARWLRWIDQELYKTQQQLGGLRRAEVMAKMDYEAERRAAELDPEAPKVGRGDDCVTVAYKEAWVGERCSDAMLVWQLALMRVLAAKTRIDVFKTIGNDVQTQNANLRNERGDRWRH